MAQRAKNGQAAAVPLGFRGIFTVFSGGSVLPQERGFLVQKYLELRGQEIQILRLAPGSDGDRGHFHSTPGFLDPCVLATGDTAP